MSVHDFWTPFSLLPFLNALIIGLSLASIWLVAALGLTIIYGTMGVINMAHGEFIMLGAYSTFVLQSFLGIPILICMPLSFLIMAGIGWLIERGIIRTLYERPLDTLLATWGLSLGVTTANGYIQLFKIDKQYISYSMVSEKLKSEGWLYFQLSGKYTGSTHKKSFHSFCEKIERIKMKQVNLDFLELSKKKKKERTY